jgi:tRNA U34 5-methylaminomethyl-2-thiouridine-forming methyltransferase MnmC
MRFEVRTTKDGSLTVFDANAGECFKSQHAACLETESVFLTPGVRENPWYRIAAPFRILELGFGLGTNYLALLESGLSAEFTSIERDLTGAEFFLAHAAQPALAELLAAKKTRHDSLSAQLIEGDFFVVLKELAERGEIFHCIFFDPFSPKSNPEAWTTELFTLAAQLLSPNGRLVTYSVSRSAKDSAVAAGLEVLKHKLPAALKKRSAMLATKVASP